MLHYIFEKGPENHFGIMETEDAGRNSGLVNLRQIASNKYSESAKRPQIIKAEQYSGKTI